MRQNLLDSLVVEKEDGTQAAPLESLKELEDLDLYDNKLSLIEGVRGLSKLECVVAQVIFATRSTVSHLSETRT